MSNVIFLDNWPDSGHVVVQERYRHADGTWHEDDWSTIFEFDIQVEYTKSDIRLLQKQGFVKEHIDSFVSMCWQKRMYLL